MLISRKRTGASLSSTILIKYDLIFYTLFVSFDVVMQGGDEEKFKLVVEAHAVLSDTRRRERYDLGEDEDGSMDSSMGGMDGMGGMSQMDMANLFSQFAAGGGGHPGFGGARGYSHGF